MHSKGGMHVKGVCVVKDGMHDRGGMRTGETATKVGGTHATGMHSSFLSESYYLARFLPETA